jgi:hypothetical protein
MRQKHIHRRLSRNIPRKLGSSNTIYLATDYFRHNFNTDISRLFRAAWYKILTDNMIEIHTIID